MIDSPSWNRFCAILRKEFIQMRRDRVTFAMMIGIPLMQLVLFGFAINSDPKHLPTVMVSGDQGPLVRDLVEGMRNSKYFRFLERPVTEEEADRMLRLGEVQFVLHVPGNFSRDLVKGLRPTLLLEADATDPSATGNAVGALRNLATTVWQRSLSGSLSYLSPGDLPVDLRIQPHYNPEGLTQYNIVPGLMGVVLTLTMVIITALAITRERERGTMETLLATPAKPVEVMVGKITPYILVGYIQVGLILTVALVIFHVPFKGSLLLLAVSALFFIAANLSMGILFSTIARNQLQAMQMAVFFFLPSLLLSGFMFPFRGMPEWAQWVGSALPLTHFLRIVRGIMLKGNGLYETAAHLWPILLFTTVVITAGSRFYRKTLD
ncbi:MAG: ABC transporter permease [Candidatus Methylacidiphilales bacterium]|nr:ABC transporter permease [Candidatus Methylacidiphilales bacterium]